MSRAGVVGADGDAEAMHRLIETRRGGMGFFAVWCDCQRDNNDRKRSWSTERENGRTAPMKFPISFAPTMTIGTGSPKTFATSADAFQILQNLIGGERGGG